MLSAGDLTTNDRLDPSGPHTSEELLSREFELSSQTTRNWVTIAVIAAAIPLVIKRREMAARSAKE